MAIFWHEGNPSRSSTENPRRITLNYRLGGSNDDAVVRAYALMATPTIHDGLYRQDIRCDNVGGDVWHISAPYGPRKQPEIGDARWSFSTTGGTAHITQSLLTVGKYPAPGAAVEDFGQAIGVTDGGDVEGCDVVIPAFRWQETWDLAAASCTFAYALTVYALSGSVNQDGFRGFQPGEVLFHGASGAPSSKDPALVEITYQFESEINQLNLTVGDIAVDAKQGHDYLWVLYEKQDGVERGTVQPRQANVERVYKRTDFTLLGIGG